MSFSRDDPLCRCVACCAQFCELFPENRNVCDHPCGFIWDETTKRCWEAGTVPVIGASDGTSAPIVGGSGKFKYQYMPDLMKIGGISGWLHVIGMAQAASMPVSSHLFIEASSHVLAVTPTCHWLEFMDFGSGILANPYRVKSGQVTAQGPGLGIEWDEAAVGRYGVQ